MIYIEDAIFDCVIINFIILYLTLFSLRLKFSFVRVLFSSCFGCLCSVGLTFLSLTNIVSIAIKLLCGIVMTLMVLNDFKIKTFILIYTVFLSFTFALGGLCFFIIYLFGGEIYSISNMTYNLPISLGVILLIMFIYVYFLINIIKIFYKKQKIENYYFNLEIQLFGKSKKIKAYLDTGNLVIDSESGCSILFVNFSLFIKLCDKKISIIDFLNGNLDSKILGRYINISTLSGNKKIFTINPDKVLTSENKELKVLIGVSLNNKFNDFDAILSPYAL